MFHTARGIIVFSERARVVMEKWAPGQVEFIPVACHAGPKIAERLNFDSAYYFINVLGRAQRLQWLETPTQTLPPEDDGTATVILLPAMRNWKLRERAAGEPMIWRDTPWIVGQEAVQRSLQHFCRGRSLARAGCKFPRSAECAAGG
jgi:hypothetical protein